MLVALALLGASCNESGNNQTTTVQNLNNFFALVTDNSNTSVSAVKNVSYTVTLNYTTMKADVKIVNLQIPEIGSTPSLTLSGMTWKAEKDGSVTISAENVTPDGNGLGNVPAFTSFKMTLLNRMVGEYFIPAASFSMLINGRFSVMSTYNYQVFFGKLISTSEDGKKFEYSDGGYEIDIDPDKRTANITLNTVRFIEQMPRAVNFDLKNLPFTLVGNKLIFDVESVVPSIKEGDKDIPYEAYKLTNFTATYDVTSGMVIGFECNPPKLGKFNVSIDTAFDSSKM